MYDVYSLRCRQGFCKEILQRIEIPPFEDTSIDTIIFRRGVWIDFQAVEPAKT